MQPVRLGEGDAERRRHGRLATQQVLEAGAARLGGVGALARRGQLHLVAEQHEAVRRARSANQVCERQLSRLVHQQHVDLAGEGPRRAADESTSSSSGSPLSADALATRSTRSPSPQPRCSRAASSLSPPILTSLPRAPARESAPIVFSTMLCTAACVREHAHAPAGRDQRRRRARDDERLARAGRPLHAQIVALEPQRRRRRRRRPLRLRLLLPGIDRLVVARDAHVMCCHCWRGVRHWTST